MQCSTYSRCRFPGGGGVRRVTVERADRQMRATPAPRRTSKWTKIEHRLFGFISHQLAGPPLAHIELVDLWNWPQLGHGHYEVVLALVRTDLDEGDVHTLGAEPYNRGSERLRERAGDEDDAGPGEQVGIKVRRSALPSWASASSSVTAELTVFRR